MLSDKAGPVQQRSTQREDAVFIGWQRTRKGKRLALYNITATGHPSFGSTVTDEGLRKLNLETPTSLPAHREPEEKTGRSWGPRSLSISDLGRMDVELENKQDKVSYSLGLSIGLDFMKDSIIVSPDAFLRGLLDAQIERADRLLSSGEVKTAMTAFQEDCRAREDRQSEGESDRNESAGERFLTDNAKLPGVVTHPSGLQHKVISEGMGEKPEENSTVEFHYSGRLLDGTLFDSSQERGRPAVFRVDSVIQGWKEALQLMSVGSKWGLFVPPSLAFGGKGVAGLVPSNATLVFEVELLSTN